MATIKSLTSTEQAWIAEQLLRAQALVEGQTPGGPLTIESLDRAWASWVAIPEVDIQKVNDTINAVGIALGQALSETTELKWVIAEDEHGTDLALFAFPGKGDVLVYPANLVAKRWEKRQANFIAAIYLEIGNQVNQLASAPPASSKPWWKVW